MVLQTLHCNDCDVVLYDQESLRDHLKGHPQLEQQTRGDNKHGIGPEPIATIRLAYDALKDIKLIDDTRENTKAKPDEYPDLINTEYEVSLFPTGKDCILHLKYHLKTMTYKSWKDTRQQ